MNGYIHSFQSMGTVDGPGVRCVIFMQGCPLRCAYCHNPDTWEFNTGDIVTPKEMLVKILRYKSYISKGGVTVSGGEALMQAEFVKELFSLCRSEGIHTALDTSGCLINRQVVDLLSVTDLCLLDIKMTAEDEYKKYTGGSLGSTLEFLNLLEEKKIPTWIRQVIVTGINDNDDNINRLNTILCSYRCIEKAELLPFKKLCKEKYDELNIEFPFGNIPETSQKTIDTLQRKIKLNK